MAGVMSSYDFQHTALLDELLTDGQKSLGWQWIAAQFNDHVPRDDAYTRKGFGTNTLPDPTWEGFTLRDEGDQNTLVPSKSPGYAVIKMLDGRCVIPATPNNIRKLDGMRPRVRIVKDIDGKEIDRVERPPLYVRLLEVPAEVPQGNGQGVKQNRHPQPAQA